jgi:outer membrane protein assembly factor BamA
VSRRTTTEGSTTKVTKSTKEAKTLFFETSRLVVFAVTFVAFVVSVGSPVAATAQTETIAEIRVHGNHTTPDGDILAIAGLSVGQEATEARLNDAARKLENSRRFEGVEVLRRFRSIASTADILVMLVVDEHPAVSDLDLTPGPFKKLGAASMWMPILNHADGYGFTYGARTTILDALGPRSSLSVPLTWGGERRAAAELERRFERGPLDVIRGTFAVNRRVNPHFQLSDRRFEAKVRAEGALTDWLRVGAGARFTDNRFGPLDNRTRAGGADVILDTRLDPTFPRNAVYASTGFEQMQFDVGKATRWNTDLRGYIGLGGSPVLALRGSLARSNAPLPLFEQALLGGSSTLRGYTTGHRAGDNLATLSAELRYPLNSPLNYGRVGLKAFIDGGTTWAHGGRLKDQRFERGIGGGFYFGAGPLIVDLDVAWPETGKPRAHFGMGVNF